MLELDQRFWKVFKQADFSNTTFGLSYMKDEDMDSHAYEQHSCITYAIQERKILSKRNSGTT